MNQIHFIEGPVGAGKSTYAKALAKSDGFTHIALDEWFVRLYSPDRPTGNFIPWYVERKDRLIDLILSYARSVLATNSIALELGLIQQTPRLALLRQLQEEGIPFCVHVLDVPKSVRRECVQRRNTEQGETFSMVVSDEIFEITSSLWEAPDEFEQEEFAFVFPAAVSR